MVKFARLIKSFLYATRGLTKTFKEEQNFRIHTFIAVAIVLVGWCFRINRYEWIILILIIGLVMLMEIANSAVERITDVLKPRINSYVKEIKDITAAGVLVASVIAIIVGLIIFLPYIFGRNFNF